MTESTRRRRPWTGASLPLLFAIGVLLPGCGSAEPSRGPNPAPASPSGSTGEVVPPAPSRPVGGAAEPIATELPTVDDALGSRLLPRELPMPTVQRGRSALFQVEQGKSGWLARLPEQEAMQLVSPAYSHGKIVLGGGFRSTSFYGLNAHTGRLEWRTMAPDGGPTAAITVEDKVIFNTESCTLFVVDPETGRILWKRWLGDPIMGQAAAVDGRIFSGHIRDGGGYGLTAMRLRDGHVLWTRNIPADVMNAPVLDGGDIFLTTMNGVVFKLDQQTGRVHWQRSLHATSAPWVDGERIHVAQRVGVKDEQGHSRRGERHAVLSRDDGQLATSHDAVPAFYLAQRADAGGVEAGWAFEGSRPTVVDGRSYQVIGHEIQSRNADSGELLWKRRYAEPGRGRPASPPAVAGSQLVFGTRDGVLHGLDIDTGLSTFAYRIGEPIAAQPIVAGGWVYATTTKGGVVGLQVADASLDGWHMWGGNAQHNGRSAEVEANTKAEAGADRPGEGTLKLAGDPGPGELLGFPLEHTKVEAVVHGFVTRVTVEQRFRNPFDRAVEGVYLFPLPDDAAVDGMELVSGERRIQGQIRRRGEARREYRQARERGALASLLEQEQPNLFRQSVANLPPGQGVKVTLRYTQVLPFEEGSYRFLYPMVAGPRYTPDSEGDGREAATTGPRAVVTAGSRPDRVEVSVRAKMGTTLHGVSSPTHAIVVNGNDADETTVRLAGGPVAPDRDLDLRFEVGGDTPEVSALTSSPAEGQDGFLTLTIHPKRAPADAEITARELVFLVDTSSSMHGAPLQLAQAAMLRALEGLSPRDTFRIVRFSDQSDELAETALPATAANLNRGRHYVEGLRALGRTEMARGVRAALEPPVADDRLRIALLLTDGYIGNEAEVLREVNAHLGQARLFGFGVGSSVNRFLLSRLAEVGRGDLQVVTLDESPEAAADAFHRRVARPFLTDLQLDWGGLEVREVYPRRIPDLFTDRPVVVHARYRNGGRGTIQLLGRIGGRAHRQSVSVELPATGAAPNPEVASLWARTRIKDRMLAMALRPNPELQEEVTELGLRHGLMTRWTSFVAVDEATVSRPGNRRVEQPASLPAGVDYGAPSGLAAAGSGSVGYASGFGGLGLTGTGYGGGGVGQGTIGLGSIGTIGHGGSSSGYGSGGGGGSGRSAAAPTVRMGSADVIVGGTLDRELIRRVIRRDLNRVRQCYESQAGQGEVNPDGRVVLRFTVGSDGVVLAAVVTENTVGSAEVGTCIRGVMEGLRFPGIPGGGVVTITYPFQFRSEGSEDADDAASTPGAASPGAAGATAPED